MMKSRFLIILTVLPSVLFGQETKMIVLFKENKSKEVYEVLRKDTTIKYGSYQKYNSNNILVVEGFYKDGLKDSCWTEYQWFDNSKRNKMRGNYSQDKKTGLWEFYNFKGILEQKYDYSSEKLVYYYIDPKEKEKQYYVYIGEDSLKTKLNRPPLYIGGAGMMIKNIEENIDYPVLAIENGIQGTIYISFAIDSSGKTTNYFVIKWIGAGCDEEALKIAKLLTGSWLPGILNGKPVNVKYILQIRFKIEYE
jgi:periplasmic protein TonB